MTTPQRSVCPDGGDPFRRNLAAGHDVPACRGAPIHRGPLLPPDTRAASSSFNCTCFLLPIRVVFYGPALMALGRTQQVLWRSIGDFALTGLLCLLFVRWFGYLGAVAALLVTIYAWSVPFNLYFISKGFGVRVKDVLPLRELVQVGVLAAIPTVLASAWRLLPRSLAARSIALRIRPCSAPLTYFLLWRAGFLPMDFLVKLPFGWPVCCALGAHSGTAWTRKGGLMTLLRPIMFRPWRWPAVLARKLPHRFHRVSGLRMSSSSAFYGSIRISPGWCTSPHGRRAG